MSTRLHQGRVAGAVEPSVLVEEDRSNVSRDRKNHVLLSAQGWRVVIVWECETKDIGKLRSKLAEEFGI